MLKYLEKGSSDIGKPGRDNYFGEGKVNAYSCFLQAKSAEYCSEKYIGLQLYFFTLITIQFHRRKSIFQPVTFTCECDDMGMVYQAIH